jgi:PKD repeat protein
MQMFLWTSASPNRDSDLDSDVIWHEYGHGLTWRMIGSMSGPLAGAIGEGMSDTLAIIINEDDVVGEWSFNNPGGIRSFPYSGYPRTYGDLTGSSVHGDGEIYAATMWRLWELWQANGLSKDLLLDYIVAGMNFTPARPAYEDMRDGILAAITDTDHQCLVWEAFAQFGIGVGAVGTESPVSVTESFFLPGLCEEDDTIPPSQVVDLSLESIDARSATLSWTATGDDGTVGNALSYDLRYSLAPITEENFGSAIQVTGLPLPNPPGTLETAGVTGLSPNTTYYFAVRVLDNVNNVSPVSNVVSDTTQPLVTVFNDDLENGADNWLITGTVDPSTGLPLWHTTSHRFSSPSTAFYYGIDGVLNYDTGSINSGQITSIPISLEGITEPSLVFNHYLRTENLSPFDAASIDVSADGGLTWTQVFLTSLSTTGTDMVEQVIDLSAFDGQIIQIRFGFDTVDSAINNFEGWVIDDIRIDGTPIFGDLPPVANAGGPYNNALGQPTLFSGSGSFDPEGQALSYSWDFGDGTSGVGETPSHIYSAVGTYTVTLVVDDGTQPSLPVTTTVEIGLPVANPGGPYSGGVTQPINFDGTQSVGLSGNPLNFSWDFGDGNTGTGAAPSHAYQSSGEYTVTLVVDDGFAPSEPVTTLVDVQLPFADPGAPYDAIVGEPITLNGSGSVGTSGNPLTYTWDFGDGSTGVGVNPTHTYAEPGVYDITLTVEDGFLPDTGDTFVIVTQTPVANPGGPYSGVVGSPVSFDGSASVASLPGEQLGYVWDFGDGSTGVGVTPAHTYAAPGNYTVTLTVDDGFGLSEPAITNAVIAAVPNIAPVIDSVSATPSSILDTETTQLAVAATDPDNGPGVLTYNWIVPTGMGSVDDSSSSTPIFTPADVSTSQDVTITVEVSDGLETVSSSIVVTVQDDSEPTQPSLLNANFDDGSIAGWTVVDQGAVQGPSNWSVVNGSLVQSSNVYSSPLDPAELGKLGTYLTYDAGSAWADYRASFTLNSSDNDSIGFMFRVQNSDNYYRFSWDQQRSFRRLVKRVDGVTTLLASDNVPYAQNTTYNVEVMAAGSVIEVSINGELVLQAIDSDLNSGSVAFYSWANNGNTFDDLTVESLAGGNLPPIISSVTATPASIVDTETSQLFVAATDAEGVALEYNWIVPVGMGSLDDANSPTPVFTPADVTDLQSVTITVEVSDGEATVSDTVVVTVRDESAAPLLLNANFDDGSIEGWSIVDQGTVQGPSNWSAASGSLVQSSNLYSSPLDPAELGKLGTYLVYDSGSEWTDYRASFTLSSSDNDSIGFMFRVQDSDNYYRFSWDQQRNFRRLVKRVDGVTTLLASDSVPYSQNTTYNVEVLVSGNQIEVSIDGELVLQATDDDLSSGSVAFYSWANNGNTFDDLRVESP